MVAKKKYVMTKNKTDFRESIKWEKQFLLKDTSQENEENKSILCLYLENFKNEVLSKQYKNRSQKFSQCMIFQEWCYCTWQRKHFSHLLNTFLLADTAYLKLFAWPFKINLASQDA